MPDFTEKSSSAAAATTIVFVRIALMDTLKKRDSHIVRTFIVIALRVLLLTR